MSYVSKRGKGRGVIRDMQHLRAKCQVMSNIGKKGKGRGGVRGTKPNLSYLSMGRGFMEIKFSLKKVMRELINHIPQKYKKVPLPHLTSKNNKQCDLLKN